ncbi:hypothetical protein D3C73_1351940 [compost metagenome]
MTLAPITTASVVALSTVPVVPSTRTTVERYFMDACMVKPLRLVLRVICYYNVMITNNR